jgi:ferredoxin-NADP reductase
MTAKLQAKVIDRVVDTPDVITIFFTVDGQPLAQKAGQYITVYFDDTDVKQGKAYSLSSCPGDEYSSITVKKIGLFSGKLHALKIGDSFTISQPYGFFHAHKNRPVVAIATGVGISPVWSIIRHEVARDAANSIQLLYSNKTEDDIIFGSAIHQLASSNEQFTYRHFVTRQPQTSHIARRMNLVQDIADMSPEHCFYVCGAQDFVASIWRQLIEAGASEDQISTETFFENRV